VCLICFRDTLRELVTQSVNYRLIVGNLDKVSLDGILHRCVLEHECKMVLYEVHEGNAGGHNAGNTTVWKVLCTCLWWSSMFEYAMVYFKHCNICQWIKNPSRRDELPLFLVTMLESFEKWEIDFMGPINLLARTTS
jgi:hypothetical protein